MSAVIGILALTLIHSLWQFCIISALAFVALSLIHERHSGLRYRILVLAHVSCVIAFLATALIASGTPSAGIGATIAPASSSNLPLIGVSLWLIGMLLPIARYARDIRNVYRLAQNYEPATPDLRQRFSDLCQRIGVRSNIQLGLSDKITSPCVILFFRPVILLPFSVLTRLSFEEIEAILAHELGHIRRRDTLYRLVQALVDTLFYYHPGVHYLSRQMSKERERACDDFAVKHIEDPKYLATGLLKSVIGTDTNSFALASAGSVARDLDDRIRRFINLPNARQQQRPLKSAIVLAVSFALVATIALVQAPKANSSAPNFTEAELISLKDDVCAEVKRNAFYNIEPYGKPGHAKIRLWDGIVYMNGTALPDSVQSDFLKSFETYRLSDYPDVRLRYLENDVTLAFRTDKAEKFKFRTAEALRSDALEITGQFQP